MAPEVEWDVDTSTGSQTIVKTPPPRSPSPRNRIIVLLVVVFGVTLGVIYRSIPEPPKPPTPTIRPTPTIAISIDRVIDQEARALERGDPQVFMRLQDPVDSQWRTQQINSFKKWGEPPDTSDLYTIINSDALGSDRRWVDISQARDGQFFRETRFYRLYDSKWVRTAPDYSLWGDGRLLRTNHFDLLYQEGDDYHAQIVAQQLEKFYTRVCQDLNCTLGKPIGSLVFRVCRALDCSDGAGVDPNPVPQFTVVMSPTIKATTAGGFSTQHITITMPSPRLSGLYFQSLYDSAPGNDEPLVQMAIDKLYVPHLVAKIASGRPALLSDFKKGDLFVGNITQWEINRIIPISAFSDAQIFLTLQNVKDQDLLSLDVLWDAIPPYDLPQSQLDMLVTETWSVIRFIETKYGSESVVHFLNAIGPAQSMSDALQNGLNVS
ncbi:MAG TPA: hypothetical protein VFF70_03230, partial [Anaerolineae bacterium]|nr:hypothetical protein [Anaerolineae bacterium]